MAFTTNLFKNAKKLGVTPVVAKRMEMEFNRMYAEAREESFIVTMALMYNALIMDFWTKTAKKKILELHKRFLSLYDAYLCETITLEDAAAYIKEETGDEIRLGNIVLKENGNWKKLERLNNALSFKQKKTKEDYKKEHQSMTEMYQFCADHLQATIKRKTTSEEKRKEAELQLKKFEAFYNTYTKQLEDECFVETGAETLKD